MAFGRNYEKMVSFEYNMMSKMTTKYQLKDCFRNLRYKTSECFFLSNVLIQ